MLIVAGPGDVAVGAQQDGGRVQFLAGVGYVVDPVRPAFGRQPARLIEQQAAARCVSP